MHIVFFAYLKIEKWRTKSMFMNILVGIMAAIAILAGVWGFWVDHRKDKDLTDETSAAGSADTISKN
jgi:hypothetical protein